ncbi:MAG: hypothetical protein CMI30_13840 [Opitutae bacterium]|nr:hypothetical protein [Opitutae bacterium]
MILRNYSIGNFEGVALSDGASLSNKKIRTSLLNTVTKLDGLMTSFGNVTAQSEVGGGVMTHQTLKVGLEFRVARVVPPGIQGSLWKFR